MEKHRPKHMSEKKRFSIIARAHSFRYAIRGMGIILKTQHNFWVQIVCIILTVIAGIILTISSLEWIAIVLAIMAVCITEALNTAIEIDIDLTSPDYHPYARDTKDVAAGAVMIAMFGAFLIGFIVFVPKILEQIL